MFFLNALQGHAVVKRGQGDYGKFGGVRRVKVGPSRVRWGQLCSIEIKGGRSGQMGSSKVRLDQMRSDEMR